MTLARAAGALLRPRPASAATLPRPRYASSHSDHHEHHDEHHAEDAVTYPKEDFSSPTWRNFVLFGLGLVAFYKYAPEPNDDAYITRFIEHYQTPAEVWERISFKHLTQSVEAANDVLTVTDAKLPPVHRYRYPQRFEQHSAFVLPVGMSVPLDNIVVKGDKQ